MLKTYYILFTDDSDFNMDLVVRAKHPNEAYNFWLSFWKKNGDLYLDDYPSEVTLGPAPSEKCLRILEFVIQDETLVGPVFWHFPTATNHVAEVAYAEVDL